MRGIGVLLVAAAALSSGCSDDCGDRGDGGADGNADLFEGPGPVDGPADPGPSELVPLTDGGAGDAGDQGDSPDLQADSGPADVASDGEGDGGLVDGDPDEVAPEVPPAPAQLLLDPDLLDLGTVAVRSEFLSMFTLENVGGAATGMPAIRLWESRDDNYTVQDNGCVQPLAGGAKCVFTVRFYTATPILHEALLTVSAAPGGTVAAPLKAMAVE